MVNIKYLLRSIRIYLFALDTIQNTYLYYHIFMNHKYEVYK